MGSRPAASTGWRTTLLYGSAIAIVLLCYVIGTPRSGGPDEPSHMVASAALVRGERDGGVSSTFEVPAMVGEPNPACWAQQPFVPAGCASLQSDSTETVTASSTSANYPPWTYVLPGLASFVPSASAYAYLARLFMALWPLGLLVATFSMVRRHGPGSSVALLLGLTPIAWFTMSVVNPSAVAIAGGLALWAALLSLGRPRVEWLLVAGWASLLLPRRDGPLWATFIVIAVAAALAVRPSDLIRTLPRWTVWALVALAPVPLLTALVSGRGGLNLLISAAPLALVGVELAVVAWRRITSPSGRLLLISGCTLAIVGTVTIALLASPGGFDTDVLRLVMAETGEHLRQLVGVLGWLDTPVPTFAVYLFWAALGGLATIAFVEQPRIAAVGLGVIVATVVVAWILELGQGATYGRYWQGRYSVPFVVGVPLLLALRRSDGTPGGHGSAMVTKVARPLGAVVWVISNAGFAAALQRWGVGLAGSWLPWRWSTYGAPVAPWILLVVHAVATAWLIVSCWSDTTNGLTLDQRSDEAGAGGPSDGLAVR